MTTQPTMTLWQAIDALAQQIPFSKTKVETTLGVRLGDRDRSNDVFPNAKSSFQSFEGGPVKLSDGAVIRKVDLRLIPKQNDPGFLVLNLEGNCIKLDMVRSHYSDLQITDHPRGHSLDEVTSYTASLRWGELSFSFKVRNPDCVSSIAFEPEGA